MMEGRAVSVLDDVSGVDGAKTVGAAEGATVEWPVRFLFDEPIFEGALLADADGAADDETAD